MSNSMQPHRQQPTRLPRPWGSPGKNTGVGCHLLLQCMKVKSESEVAQSCPTLSDPMDCSPPGSSIHGIFQARVLEWGAIAFSREVRDGLFPPCEHTAVCKPGSVFSSEPDHTGTLILAFSTSRTMRNMFLLFKSCSLWHFVKAAQTD